MSKAAEKPRLEQTAESGDEAPPEPVGPFINPRDAVQKTIQERRRAELRADGVPVDEPPEPAPRAEGDDDADEPRQHEPEPEDRQPADDTEPPDMPERREGEVFERDGAYYAIVDGNEVAYADLMAGYERGRSAEEKLRQANEYRAEAMDLYRRAQAEAEERAQASSAPPEIDEKEVAALQEAVDKQYDEYQELLAGGDFDEAKDAYRKLRSAEQALYAAAHPAPQTMAAPIDADEVARRVKEELRAENERDRMRTAYEKFRSKNTDIEKDDERRRHREIYEVALRRANPDMSIEDALERSAQMYRNETGLGVKRTTKQDDDMAEREIRKKQNNDVALASASIQSGGDEGTLQGSEVTEDELDRLRERTRQKMKAIREVGYPASRQ